MATLTLAELYQQALVQKFVDEMKFTDLWNNPSNSQVKFVGAKTVHIPSLTTTGAVDHNRDALSGFTRNVDDSYQTKTLSHDRKWSTLIDPMDMDETNQAVTIANITDTFNRFSKIPELDSYMISKIYSEAVRLGNTVDATVITVDNVLQKFDDFMQAMDDAEVPDNGRILYVTPAIHNLVKNSSRITRFQDVQDPTSGVNRTVLSLDGVKLIVVPANRMKSAYDFTTGAVSAVGAKQVQMLLVHPSVLLAPMKYDYVDISAPSAQSEGKYLYFERFYCDVFAFDNRAGGIQISAV